MLRQRVMTGIVLALLAIPIGIWRLERSDAGAARLTPGERVAIEGTISAVPRRFGDGVLFTVDTAAGRLVVRTGGATSPLAAGDHVRVRGRAEPVGEWIEGYLHRLGAHSWLRARRVITHGPGRGGPVGVLDATRNRAAAAIDRSMPAAEAALMRGFVLGDDSAVPPPTAEDFKRSGLAHLLAVSGQNVVLLLAFATAILIAFGVPRRRRWPLLAAAVALYVPIAGGGPSIQRAGVMGLVGLLAASLERPLDRWWALYLAAVATLAWNPLSAGDVGWQLSFAAVAGIAIGARPLAAAIRSRLGARAVGARAGLAEGAAITASATLATAPLMAHHFGAVSIAALPANLLALPAVAPAMWTGMAIAVAGQLPALPLDPLGWLAGVEVGYIEWVASTLSNPGWALIDLPLPGAWMVVSTYLLVGSLIIVGRGAWGRFGSPFGSRGGAVVLVSAVALTAGIGIGLRRDAPPAGQGSMPGWRFETRILDVGQGDAILLRERDGPAVLVDTGYPGSGAEQRLRELGIDHLDALVLTHADADHAGNLEAIAGAVQIDVVIENGLDRGLTTHLRHLGLSSRVVAAGDRLRFDRIRLDVIWPPPGAPDPGDEPNNAAIVIVAGWRGFTELLTADAEAESASYPAPDVDVLKIPHHGSDDAGLPGLLTDAAPELTVVSVGSDNTYGHPTDSSLDAVAASGVPLLRTDEDGEVRIAADRRTWAVAPDP